LPAEQPFYFLHIQKSAGITFFDILRRHFTPAQICPTALWGELINIPTDRWPSYRLFRGHFNFFFTRMLPRPLRVLALFRDPVQRTISHYDHCRRFANHPLHATAQTSTLEEFLRDPVANAMVRNFATRALAVDLDPYALAAGLTPSQLEQFGLEMTIETAKPCLPDQDLLDLAVERTQSLEFVGIVERFEESVALLDPMFGWPAGEYENQNVSPNHECRPDPSPAALELIEEATQLDARLYAHAVTMLDTTIERYSARAGPPDCRLSA